MQLYHTLNIEKQFILDYIRTRVQSFLPNIFIKGEDKISSDYFSIFFLFL